MVLPLIVLPFEIMIYFSAKLTLIRFSISRSAAVGTAPSFLIIIDCGIVKIVQAEAMESLSRPAFWPTVLLALIL